MPENANTMLQVRLAGGEYGDFYPYNLVLEEGFSRLYKGELTVFTGKLHTHEALSELVDQGISLVISQKLGDGRTLRTRYLHGIITGITGSGVFGAGDQQDCYSYILTIEPELARLRYTRSSQPFYRMTPVDVVEQILAKHGLQAQVSGDYLNRQRFSKKLMFDQSGVSDLEFMLGILDLYGLSFTFLHQRVGKTGLGKVELVLSWGDTFPVPDLDYSDKRKIPDVTQFDFLISNEVQEIWKMDTWHITETMGVDGVELTAPYPNANYGSDQWRQGVTSKGSRYFNFNRMFHGYERDTENAEVDADIKLILDARYRALQLAKSKWTGEALNVALQPGRILELVHFYGMRDKRIITAQVTGVRLHCRMAWPQDLAVSPEGRDLGETLEVRCECMNYGSGVQDKRYCAGALELY
ncbi:MAG: phage late control D family protein [Treponema sp.]|jgi:hypothetical protein|nr:phage late control D family protein [Treponema sp.]